MTGKWLLFAFFTVAAFGVTKNDMFSMYGKKEYEKCCLAGKILAPYNETDEKFWRIYGNACIKSDYVDLALQPAVKLGREPDSREAASAFTTVILKKKLLLQSMLDKADISGLKLPKVDVVLSEVFDKYAAKEYTATADGFKIKGEKAEYMLRIQIDRGIKKVVIDEINGGSIVKKHTYW